MKYNGKILFIGYGSVARCTLPILLENINVSYTNITVMDFTDFDESAIRWLERGVKFVSNRITPDNLAAVLEEHLATGDLLIDLAWNIDSCAIIEWCNAKDVLYINASIEEWDPYTDAEKRHPTERSLYPRHMCLVDMQARRSNRGTTAVVSHGANPGLVSHFVKQGLTDIAARQIAEGIVLPEMAQDIQRAVSAGDFARLAMLLDVKVIQCSERDTQTSLKPKRVNEFVGTWSVDGLYEEATTVVELGWGTHENILPDYAYEYDYGPKNQLCLSRMGMNVWMRSWVPDYCIRGMCIRHHEALTICDYLTVSKNGQPQYRPTVYYAYCPSDAAQTSLIELKGRDYVLQDEIRIMNDDIVSGSDILGALIMGHKYNSWWVGSDLDIEEARRLAPGQNATTVQVAIGVVAAVMWMIENPARGICMPEDLPHEYVVAIAKPYLGNWISKPVDWTPLKHYDNKFPGYNTPDIDPADPWQFRNFLIETE